MKVKTIKSTIKDQGLAEMFNQMLGAGSVNMNVCYPKYDNIRENAISLLKVIELFNASPFLASMPNMAEPRNDTNLWLEKAKHEMDTIFNVNLKDVEWNLNLVDDAVKEDFSQKYEAMKKCEIIRATMAICSTLVPHKKHFEDAEKLSHKFLLNMPGTEFNPYPFANINFKMMFDVIYTGDEAATKRELKFMLIVMSKLYTLTRVIFDHYNKPDIDVDEFVRVIMENIGEVQKHIPRCEKAFKKIRESISLLKNNFGEYYRDFVTTKNNMIIMENFVSDVAKETQADPETTAQFRRIIAHYRETAKHHIKNPKINMLFEKVNENFAELEKHENLVNIKKFDGPDPVDNSAELAAAAAKKAEIEAERAAAAAAYNEKSVDEIMRENGLNKLKKK